MRKTLMPFAVLSASLLVSLFATGNGRAADLIEQDPNEPEACCSPSADDADRSIIEHRRRQDAARWRRAYREGLADGERQGRADPCTCTAPTGYVGYAVPVVPSYAYWYGYSYAYGTGY